MEAFEGRIVHYVIGGGEVNAGQCRPAIIARAWSPTTANLQVFFDGLNDFPGHTMDFLTNSWVTSVVEDSGGTAGRSWHDPRECPHAPKVESVPPAKTSGGSK